MNGEESLTTLWNPDPDHIREGPNHGYTTPFVSSDSLGRPSSLALTVSCSRRMTTLISIPGQTQLVSRVRQSV